MDNFFKPQSPSVNLDLTGDTEQLKKDLQEFGLNEAIISSGRRDPKGTLDILQQRKQREGLSKIEDPGVQEVLDHFLLRGKVPEKLDYPSNTDWRNPLKQQLEGRVPDVDSVAEAVSRIRGDFGGYQSPHLDGRKVDLSAKDYGQDKLQQLQKFLKGRGYEAMYEPNAGHKGVLDIRLKDVQKQIQDAEASDAPKEELEQLKLQETALESAIKEGSPEPAQIPMMRPDQLAEQVATTLADTSMKASPRPPQTMPIEDPAPEPAPQEMPLEDVAEPVMSPQDQVQQVLERLKTEVPQEEGMPTIDPNQPEAFAGPVEDMLQRLRQEQGQESGIAQRLKDAQDDQRRELASLAFLRGGQRDRKGAQEILGKLASSRTQEEKDLIAAELQDQEIKDEKSSRNVFRQYLKKQSPEMEVGEDVPVQYLQKLVALNARGAGASPFQQSQYLTQTGDPVIFDKITGRYNNVVTGEAIKEPGSLIRNYVKTVTDPRTGEIIEVRPGVGMVGTLASDAEGPGRTVPEEQKVDVTFEMLNPSQRKDFKEVEKEFMSDIKESREFGDTLEGITDLVNADISAAIPAIKRQLARSVGREVGVMTDADVAAFSGDQSLIGALERFAKMQASGTMTQRDKDQYAQLINISRRNLGEALRNRSSYHIERLGNRIPGASQDSLKNLMSVDASMPLGIKEPQAPEGKIRVELPNGTKGFIDQDKLDGFKKAYPKAKVFN